jgi:hypothetical protein
MRAPVILFAYHRPWHTEQTLRALQQNEGADQSILYIYCDGAKPTANTETRNHIEQVRQLAHQEQWCGTVRVIERTENWGLAKSVVSGVTAVIQQYGKVIVLEDDIVTAKGFLNYMNDALLIYEEQSTVFGISGYQYPTRRPIEQDTYFLPIGSSWSWATWQDRWETVNMDATQLKAAIDAKSWEQKMNFNDYPFYQMLVDQLNGKVDSWAIRFYASFFLQEKYFLFPNRSLVQNIGYGEAATHTQRQDHFSAVDIAAEQIAVQPQPIKLDSDILKSIILKPSLWTRLLTGFGHLTDRSKPKYKS